MHHVTHVLNLFENDFAAIEQALSTLENVFSSIEELTPEQRHDLVKMGDKSEPFCRQALLVLAQNRSLLPPSFNIDDAITDLAMIDKLRPYFARINRLQSKADSADIGMGNDVILTCLDGYNLLKIVGKGSDLESLRDSMAARFNRRGKKKTPPTDGTA